MTIDTHASTSTSSSPLDISPVARPTRTALVVGASYGGHRAVQQLITTLPSSWRVVVLERNTHFNHLYAFPRVAVVPGHEHKVFIPYTKIFEPQPPLGPVTTHGNVFIHGSLRSLSMTKQSLSSHTADPFYASSNRDEASSGNFGGRNDQDCKVQSQQTFGRGVAHYVAHNDQHKEMSDDHEPIQSIAFDFLVYAMGSHLPPPINVWSTANGAVPTNGISKSIIATNVFSTSPLPKSQSAPTHQSNQSIDPLGGKALGMRWLRDAQAIIQQAESIVVIGGGALGVQFASDIAWLYGTQNVPAKRGESTLSAAPRKPKQITLLSSSSRILPRFGSWMHEQACMALQDLGIDVWTNARADLAALPLDAQTGRRRKIRTLDGRQVEADLVLFCTGQRPNTQSLCGMMQDGHLLVNPASGAAYVTPHLQLAFADRIARPELGHIFVIGDAADAFGALNAGHTAFAQADTAARNVAKLVARQEGLTNMKKARLETLYAPLEHRSEDKLVINNSSNFDWVLEPLDEYAVEPHKIKVSVGLDRAINENTGTHRIIEGGIVDLNTPSMWTRRGLSTADMFV